MTDSPQKPSMSPAEQKRLSDIFNRMARHPEGAALIRFFQDEKIGVIFSADTNGGGAVYSAEYIPANGQWTATPGTKMIEINPHTDDNRIISSLFHEGQHAKQDLAGVFYPDKLLSAHDFVWYTRMTEADAQANAVINLLKMKLQGDALPFDQEKNGVYSSMFTAAENGYSKDPTSLDDGSLKRDIFDAWFICPGLKSTYNRAVTLQNLPWIGWMLEYYPDHGLTKADLTTAEIEKIGTASQEKINYLTLPGAKPLDDPYYKDGFEPWFIQRFGPPKTPKP